MVNTEENRRCVRPSDRAQGKPNITQSAYVRSSNVTSSLGFNPLVADLHSQGIVSKVRALKLASCVKLARCLLTVAQTILKRIDIICNCDLSQKHFSDHMRGLDVIGKNGRGTDTSGRQTRGK